jgi:hypothetical protein
MESSFKMLQNGHLKCLVWNLYEEVMNHQIFIKLFIKEFNFWDNLKVKSTLIGIYEMTF